ncbi:MAG: hypothetical protein KDD34_00255 [Bdellovibrionales bacterium]|nr:hypothetical protein [Bdellovibrionales bacterium]
MNNEREKQAQMSDVLALKKCPHCGASTEDLLPIETGMKVALQAAGMADGLPSMVCANCYDNFTSQVSQGVKLRIEQETREKNKVMLWKNRVNLIKQARGLMAQKAYSEAAVSYEKYLRILEVIYSRKKGELDPKIFNHSKKSKEVTVITSVYWDLMRIYDMSPRYGDRMAQAAAKLSLFVPYSQIYPDIIKKAEAFQRSAKNPHIVKQFLRQSRSGRPRCFIATAVFESPYAQEVQTLRWFRDTTLKRTYWGRQFVYFYYKISPTIAHFIDKSPLTKKILRYLLKKIVNAVISP